MLPALEKIAGARIAALRLLILLYLEYFRSPVKYIGDGARLNLIQ